MLNDKIQKYLFGLLLSEKPVFYKHVSDDKIAFMDGVRFFIFPIDKVKFDISKCEETDKLTDNIQKVAEDVEVKITEECRANDDCGIIYRKLVSSTGRDIWVNGKYIKDYRKYTFFVYSNYKRILVVDDYGEPIAALLPARIDNEEIMLAE